MLSLGGPLAGASVDRLRRREAYLAPPGWTGSTGPARFTVSGQRRHRSGRGRPFSGGACGSRTPSCRLVRRADRGGRPGCAVHRRRVPARPDPAHPGRVPAPRPGPGGEGRRARRGRASPPDRRGSRSRCWRRWAKLPGGGKPILPVTALTEAHVIAAAAALLAVAAVLALAVGAALRRGALAVTAVIAGDRAAVPARDRGPARRRRGMGAADHPGRRHRRRSRASRLLAGHQRLHADVGYSRSRRGPGSRCCAPGP